VVSHSMVMPSGSNRTLRILVILVDLVVGAAHLPRRRVCVSVSNL
jgi:hypothetical protein